VSKRSNVKFDGALPHTAGHIARLAAGCNCMIAAKSCTLKFLAGFESSILVFENLACYVHPYSQLFPFSFLLRDSGFLLQWMFWIVVQHAI